MLIKACMVSWGSSGVTSMELPPSPSEVMEERLPMPTTSTRRPRTSITVIGEIRSPSCLLPITSERSVHQLAARIGKLPQVPYCRMALSAPRSKSWLPKAKASSFISDSARTSGSPEKTLKIGAP